MKRLLLAAAMLTLVGCGEPTAADMLRDLHAVGFECDSRNDTAAVCRNEAGATIVQTDIESVGLVVAMIQDRGEPGPWVTGGTWLISPPDLDTAALVADTLGGKIVWDWRDVD